MYRYRIILTLLIGAVMVTAGYCQEKPENHLIKNITGTVMSTDSVGNSISIRTDDQQEMAFSVPDKPVISQDTRNIGLMDIGKSDSVTIKYYVSSSSKNIIVSIIDNESIVNE